MRRVSPCRRSIVDLVGCAAHRLPSRRYSGIDTEANRSVREIDRDSSDSDGADRSSTPGIHRKDRGRYLLSGIVPRLPGKPIGTTLERLARRSHRVRLWLQSASPKRKVPSASADRQARVRVGQFSPRGWQVLDRCVSRTGCHARNQRPGVSAREGPDRTHSWVIERCTHHDTVYADIRSPSSYGRPGFRRSTHGGNIDVTG